MNNNNIIQQLYIIYINNDIIQQLYIIIIIVIVIY